MLKNRVIWEKIKFFITRSLSYSILLCVPIWASKIQTLPFVLKWIFLLSYQSLLISIWFFLGKEWDYYLRNFYKVCSGTERILIRFTMGFSFFMAYLLVVDFIFSEKWCLNLLWLSWAVLGLYYSWPTRGSVIKESLWSHFIDVKNLDYLDRYLIIGIFILNVFSLSPLTSWVQSPLANENFLLNDINFPLYLRFLKIIYLPFVSYGDLYKVLLSTHFSLFMQGWFLFSLFVIFRYFFSRRSVLIFILALSAHWYWKELFMPYYLNLGFFSWQIVVLLHAVLLMCRTHQWKLTSYFMALKLIFSTYSFLFYSVWFATFILLFRFELSKQSQWWKKKMRRHGLGWSLYILVLIVLHQILRNSDLDLNQYWYSLHSSAVHTPQAIFKLMTKKSLFKFWLVGFIVYWISNLFETKKSVDTFEHWKNRMTLKLKGDVFSWLLLSLFLVFYIALVWDLTLVINILIVGIVLLGVMLLIESFLNVFGPHRGHRNFLVIILTVFILIDSHLDASLKKVFKLISMLK